MFDIFKMGLSVYPLYAMSNKNKKKQQPKKRMNPETKAKIFTGLKTILSNNACRDAAREWKGASQIVPIIFALLATVLAVLPTFVTQMNVQGSNNIYSSPSGEYDVGLPSFTYRLTHDEEGTPYAADQIVHISWDEKGNLTTKNIDKLYHENDEATIKHWYRLTDSYANAPLFEVFFIESFKDNAGNLKYTDEEFFKLLARNEDPDTQDVRGKDKTISCSYIAFGKERMAYAKVNVTGTMEGRYDRLAGTDLATFGPGNDVTFMSKSYRETIDKNWKTFINATYETLKVSSAWTFTGIMAGVDFGMVLLFGILLFVMTRGKNNPYRVVNIWDTMKMAGFASLTPAIITLALGFWLTQYAYLIFMFTYGLRVMWLSMKSLRPMPQ